jgi:hypothetical protein
MQYQVQVAPNPNPQQPSQVDAAANHIKPNESSQVACLLLLKISQLPM